MTVTDITRVTYPSPNVYRLDRTFRWEAGSVVDGVKMGGKFAPAPDVLPAPATLVNDANKTDDSANVEHCNRWRVRCVKKADGSWSVVYEDDPLYHTLKMVPKVPGWVAA